MRLASVLTNGYLRYVKVVSIFDSVWESLNSRERHRVTHLFIDRIAYDGRDSSGTSAPSPPSPLEPPAQDVRESACESCSALTRDNTTVDCREWFYRGQLFPYAPLAMLVEAIMEAMLKIDNISEVDPTPLDELPANLQRYFANKREEGCCCG